MHILIAVHGYPPTHNGGAERRAERTARALVTRGHDVSVLCVETTTAAVQAAHSEEREQDGVLVRRLHLRTGLDATPLRWSYDHPHIGAALADLIRRQHPAVVHLFSGYVMSSSIVRVAAAHGIPVVVSLTDFWWLCHRINLLRTDGTRCDGPSPLGCARCHAEMYRRFRLPAKIWPQAADHAWRLANKMPTLREHLGVGEQLERAATLQQALAQAAILIAPSQYLADMYVRHGVARDRLRVWRQGVDLNQCILRAPAAELRFGYLGQVKWHKGVDLLIEAWGRLQGDTPRHLSLYGSDTGEEAYGQKLRQRIANLPDVHWSGQFHGSDVWRVLAGLDIIIVPSRWVENSPNTILEAQAVGVPVIGSDLGGVAELVRHEQNGLLFAADDVDDLARQLQRLVDDPDLLARLRRATPLFRSLDNEIDQLEGLYGELVEQIQEPQACSLVS